MPLRWFFIFIFNDINRSNGQAKVDRVHSINLGQDLNWCQFLQVFGQISTIMIVKVDSVYALASNYKRRRQIIAETCLKICAFPVHVTSVSI